VSGISCLLTTQSGPRVFKGMINKKYVRILTLLCLWLVVIPGPAKGSDLQKAASLYKAGEYLESIANCSSDSDTSLYQIYLNEKEIGARADYESTLPESHNAKYIQYVKKNPELFVYNEAAGGIYEPSTVRYDEIKRIVPGSKYLGLIELDRIKSFDTAVWEDGDGSAHSNNIVARYTELIKRYPEAGFVDTVKQRIQAIKAKHKRITGKDL